MTNQPIFWVKNTMLCLSYLMFIFVFLSTCTTQNTPSPDSFYHTTELKLANQIKVIHHNNPRADYSQINIFFIGGHSRLFPQNKGMETIALNYAMTEGYGFPQSYVQEQLRLLKATIYCQSTYDFSFCTLRAPSDNFLKSFVILRSLILFPTFPKSALIKIKTTYFRQLTNQMALNSQSVAHITEGAFFEDHPYFVSPAQNIKNVEKLNRNQIISHYKHLLNSRRILISFSGKQTPEKIKRIFEVSFGQITPKNFNPFWLPQLVNPNQKVVIPAYDQTKAYIFGNFIAPNAFSADFWPLIVATNILNRQLQSNGEPGNRPSISHFFVEITKRNFGSLFAILSNPLTDMNLISQLIRNLRTKRVDSSTLNLAKQDLKTTFLNRYHQANISFSLGKWQIVSGKWRNLFRAYHQIDKINPQMVQFACQKYLKNYTFEMKQQPWTSKPTASPMEN